MKTIYPWAVFLCCLFPTFGSAQNLPVRMQRAIETRLVPAFHNGNTVEVLEFIVGMARDVAPEQWPKIDRELKRHQLPGLGTLIVDSRLQLVKANYGGPLPDPTPMELELVLPALEAEVKKSIRSVLSPTRKRRGRLKSEQLTFDDYESAIWDTHVANNQLLTLLGMVTFGEELAKTSAARRLQEKNGSDSIAERLNQLRAQIEDAARDNEEKSVLLRIDRLDHALKVFETEDSSLVDRILGAWVADSDGEFLESFFRSTDDANGFRNRRLRADGLADQIKATSERVHELAGPDLVRKSRLFHTGLHWWFRGRYGAGPAGYGFLKHPRALEDPQAMLGSTCPSRLRLRRLLARRRRFRKSTADIIRFGSLSIVAPWCRLVHSSIRKRDTKVVDPVR